MFRELLNQCVIVYIDDILIYSRNEAGHRHHVSLVLQKLCEHHLYLKAEKCSFHTEKVQFLGYYISASGICMDEGKVAAVESWPFFSRKFTPVEQNYDISNRELLAIKLALATGLRGHNIRFSAHGP